MQSLAAELSMQQIRNKRALARLLTQRGIVPAGDVVSASPPLLRPAYDAIYTPGSDPYQGAGLNQPLAYLMPYDGQRVRDYNDGKCYTVRVMHPHPGLPRFDYVIRSEVICRGDEIEVGRPAYVPLAGKSAQPVYSPSLPGTTTTEFISADYAPGLPVRRAPIPNQVDATAPPQRDTRKSGWYDNTGTTGAAGSVSPAGSVSDPGAVSGFSYLGIAAAVVGGIALGALGMHTFMPSDYEVGYDDANRDRLRQPRRDPKDIHAEAAKRKKEDEDKLEARAKANRERHGQLAGR